MSKIKIEDLKKACQIFRDQIIKNDKIKENSIFREFPNGCCADASLILAKFLEQKGFGICKYVRGQKGIPTHAWLENEGFIIDITADQFDEIDEMVIVSKNSEFHLEYDIICKASYKESFGGGGSVDSELVPIYDEIVNSIKKQENKERVL